jgi:hypothetical protein
MIIVAYHHGNRYGAASPTVPHIIQSVVQYSEAPTEEKLPCGDINAYYNAKESSFQLLSKGRQGTVLCPLVSVQSPKRQGGDKEETGDCPLSPHAFLFLGCR